VLALAALISAAGSGYAEAPRTQASVSRSAYAERLQGFWLGQCVANWTGLTTEMVRCAAPFYTDDDWGKPVGKTIGGGVPAHAEVIDFVIKRGADPWGSDDDTDIEYMYLHALHGSDRVLLSGDQVRATWLRHIYSNEDAPLASDGKTRENFLWVSNEAAYYLMKDHGLTPPETSDPQRNPLHAMIDAQLTTEIFGLMAPGRPDVALRLARLPIRTTASGEAAEIAEFYVVMHSLAVTGDSTAPIAARLLANADRARSRLAEGSYPAKMYDFVKGSFEGNPDKEDWELTRDAVYTRYQLGNADGYEYREPYDAGINFASSLVSLFYGGGDYRNTVRIGTLAGWDSDNPTATWGGLIGFMLGRQGVERALDRRDISQAYWIHRTRRGFPDRTPSAAGEDTFSMMAARGVEVVDCVVVQEMGGSVDRPADTWLIPGFVSPQNTDHASGTPRISSGHHEDATP
jgi:hypothetical protein